MLWAHPLLSLARPTCCICLCSWIDKWGERVKMTLRNIEMYLASFVAVESGEWCAYGMCKKVDKTRKGERYCAYDIHTRERAKVIQFQKVNHMCVLTNYQREAEKNQKKNPTHVQYPSSGVISLIHCGFNLVKKSEWVRVVKNLHFGTIAQHYVIKNAIGWSWQMLTDRSKAMRCKIFNFVCKWY